MNFLARQGEIYWNTVNVLAILMFEKKDRCKQVHEGYQEKFQYENEVSLYDEMDIQ